jgi:hypothetical protein
MHSLTGFLERAIEASRLRQGNLPAFTLKYVSVCGDSTGFVEDCSWVMTLQGHHSFALKAQWDCFTTVTTTESF